jgi:hypothetical protein
MDNKLQKAAEKFYSTPITQRLLDKEDFDSLSELWLKYYGELGILPIVYKQGDKVIIKS